MTTTFNVTMDVDDMEGKTVLVFLKPQHPEANYKIHAWQVLNGSAHSTETFTYQAKISLDVTNYGFNDNPIVSGPIGVKAGGLAPGQLIEAISPNRLSPKLQRASSGLAHDKLTAQQVGVVNHTSPFIQFDANWYVNEKPVVTAPQIDRNMTCSFQYEPHFYFMVAAPPLIGRTYIVQNFSDMTKYEIDITTSEVFVTLTKSKGIWNFDFSSKD